MKHPFGEILLHWYLQYKRVLPWRGTRDPYKIWLSEILLQQTRVNQGMAYYQRFISAFPNVFSLAEAPADQVYKLWQGLGYYNRADNLMKTAQKIVSDFGGAFPEDFDTLKSLPGIGDYTAAAVASLAFDRPHAVVDGNVYRVLSRFFGIKTPVNTAKGKKEFTALAQKLLAGYPPAGFNQALMEFGALYCVPKNPDCPRCVFFNDCFAGKRGRQAEFPVKRKKTASGKRFYYYFVLKAELNGFRFVYLKKRTGRDIWRNLYDFPALQTDTALGHPLDSLPVARKEGPLNGLVFSAGPPSQAFRQQLTHLQVTAFFIPLFLQKPLSAKEKNSLSLVQENQLSNYPVPRLIARYLQENKLIKD